MILIIPDFKRIHEIDFIACRCVTPICVMNIGRITTAGDYLRRRSTTHSQQAFCVLLRNYDYSDV